MNNFPGIFFFPSLETLLWYWMNNGHNYLLVFCSFLHNANPCPYLESLPFSGNDKETVNFHLISLHFNSKWVRIWEEFILAPSGSSLKAWLIESIPEWTSAVEFFLGRISERLGDLATRLLWVICSYFSDSRFPRRLLYLIGLLFV